MFGSPRQGLAQEVFIERGKTLPPTHRRRHARVDGRTTGQETQTRGATGRPGIESVELHALLGKGIGRRRFDGAAVVADIGPAQVVGDKDNQAKARPSRTCFNRG